ncbi:DUF192 domain-containing protein [Thermoproteota archaeon]
MKLKSVFLSVICILGVLLTILVIMWVHSHNVPNVIADNFNSPAAHLNPLKFSHVLINNQKIAVEIADTEKTRTKGLMYRKKLADNNGMLFIYPQQDIYPFWMKNTYIPLDIIWINSDFKVVFIKYNAQPLSETPIIPGEFSKYILEINAGKAKALGIVIGNILKIY